MDDHDTAWLFIVGLFLGGGLMALIGLVPHNIGLNNCEEANNVYQCEYIAIPKAQESE